MSRTLTWRRARANLKYEIPLLWKSRELFKVMRKHTKKTSSRQLWFGVVNFQGSKQWGGRYITFCAKIGSEWGSVFKVQCYTLHSFKVCSAQSSSSREWFETSFISICSAQNSCIFSVLKIDIVWAVCVVCVQLFFVLTQCTR